MNNENTIVARRMSNGTVVQIVPDGSARPLSARPLSARPLKDETDWDRLRAMTDEEVTKAASADPDAQPLNLDRLHRVPRTKTMRRALALTQEEFALAYHIPLGTLRDWEQGRCEPDQPARAYLRVIAHDPEGVRRALSDK